MPTTSSNRLKLGNLLVAVIFLVLAGCGGDDTFSCQPFLLQGNGTLSPLIQTTSGTWVQSLVGTVINIDDENNAVQAQDDCSTMVEKALDPGIAIGGASGQSIECTCAMSPNSGSSNRSPIEPSGLASPSPRRH